MVKPINVLAMESVKNGCSISQAARAQVVPYSTLHDRLSGRVSHPGLRPYLSKCEEKDLSEFLVEVAKAGYGKSRQQVKSLAANAIHGKGLLDTGSKLLNGWYYQFINRNQQFVLRRETQLLMSEWILSTRKEWKVTFQCCRTHLSSMIY